MGAKYKEYRKHELEAEKLNQKPVPTPWVIEFRKFCKKRGWDISKIIYRHTKLVGCHNLGLSNNEIANYGDVFLYLN
jgi:hypothetical protein